MSYGWAEATTAALILILVPGPRQSLVATRTRPAVPQEVDAPDCPVFGGDVHPKPVVERRFGKRDVGDVTVLGQTSSDKVPQPARCHCGATARRSGFTIAIAGIIGHSLPPGLIGWWVRVR